MANFIVNTTADKAIRKSEVVHVSIIDKTDHYELWIYVTGSPKQEIVFEVDETLEGIQTKANNVVTELEL